MLQKFQQRSTVVSSGEREKYWKHLSLMYVTEESDDPDNPNGLLEHKLPWRCGEWNWAWLGYPWPFERSPCPQARE